MKAKRILFVDDDPAIQDAVRIMLERVGYDVTVLDTGNSLLEEGCIYPDLFILDKQLPGVDGLDICRYLKSRNETKHLPVLILSASPQIARQAADACADALLEKPFKMQELRKTVKNLIRETALSD